MRYYAYSFDWLHGVVSICRSGGLGGGGTIDLVVPQKVINRSLYFVIVYASEDLDLP